MNYLKYKYIFPPRPKNAVSPSELSYYDNDNNLIYQPKLNGSNISIYCNGKDVMVMNRHGKILTGFDIDYKEILLLYRGSGWMVLNAEYMNKSQKDETNCIFNHKLVIFDILVYNGNYLIGSTFQDRVGLLDDIYGIVESDKEYLYSISENIYRVKTYCNNCSYLFNDLIKIQMYEGLVFKRKAGKLEMGLKEDNTSRSQFKIRKPTKNYRY